MVQVDPRTIAIVLGVYWVRERMAIIMKYVHVKEFFILLFFGRLTSFTAS